MFMACSHNMNVPVKSGHREYVCFGQKTGHNNKVAKLTRQSGVPLYVHTNNAKTQKYINAYIYLITDISRQFWIFYVTGIINSCKNEQEVSVSQFDSNFQY